MKALSNVRYMLSTLTDICQVVAKLTLGICSLKEHVIAFYKYMHIIASHEVNPLIPPHCNLKNILFDVKMKSKHTLDYIYWMIQMWISGPTTLFCNHPLWWWKTSLLLFCLFLLLTTPCKWTFTRSTTYLLFTLLLKFSFLACWSENIQPSLYTILMLQYLPCTKFTSVLPHKSSVCHKYCSIPIRKLNGAYILCFIKSYKLISTHCFVDLKTYLFS